MTQPAHSSGHACVWGVPFWPATWHGDGSLPCPVTSSIRSNHFAGLMFDDVDFIGAPYSSYE
jgi:hypothetical protein